jgi:hypothetical protein
MYDNDLDIKVYRKVEHAENTRMMLKSKFCIQADGQAAWSPRLVECASPSVSSVLLYCMLNSPSRLLGLSVHVSTDSASVPTLACLSLMWLAKFNPL